MQSSRITKRTRRLSATNLIAVIGSVLLLFAASYMAYDAIDTQARMSSLQ